VSAVFSSCPSHLGVFYRKGSLLSIDGILANWATIIPEFGIVFD